MGVRTYAGGKGVPAGRWPTLEEVLRLNSGLRAALIDRGNMYRESGSAENAVRDFDAVTAGSQVVSRYTWFRDGHFFRAVARCIQRTGELLRPTWSWQDGEDFGSHRHFGMYLVALRDSKATTCSSCLL